MTIMDRNSHNSGKLFFSARVTNLAGEFGERLADEHGGGGGQALATLEGWVATQLQRLHGRQAGQALEALQAVVVGGKEQQLGQQLCTTNPRPTVSRGEVVAL